MLTWQGRRLESYTDSESEETFTYTYNSDGIRTSKTIDGVEHIYHLSGTQVLSEEWTENGVQHLLIYIYDVSGAPIGMAYRDSTYVSGAFDFYLFAKNIQGDILYIYNSSGTRLVTYTYDAWGKCYVTYQNGGASTSARYNPFRYRGYYYDTETGLYYVSSRYYDPEVGRWISTETSVDCGSFDVCAGIIGYNAYVYCANSPVIYKDASGESITLVICGVTLGAKAIIGLVGAIIATSALIAYTTNPDFRKGFDNMIFSTISAIESGLMAIGGAMINTAKWVSTKAKSIANSIADSFAQAKTIPNYRSDKEWHHIVAKKAPNAQRARDILDAVGIGYNSPYNLVLLKTGLHRRLHTNTYYGFANSVVISAYEAANGDPNLQLANVIIALDTLRRYLEAINAVSPY